MKIIEMLQFFPYLREREKWSAFVVYDACIILMNNLSQNKKGTRHARNSRYQMKTLTNRERKNH